MSTADAAPPAASSLGDRRTALADLYRAEYRSLVRLAVLLVDRRDIAEELVQDAFVRLDRNWDRVVDPAARPAYLRSIVCNLCRSKLRRRQVARRHVPASDPALPGVDESIMLASEHRRALDAVRDLPARQREVVVLRYWQELSEQEIAATLGISAGSVKTHAHRALLTLTRRLEEGS